MNWAGWLLAVIVLMAVVSMIADDMGAGYRRRAAKTAISGTVFLILLWLAAQGARP
jgi:Na+-driven multidrug efflux pump